MERQLLLAPAIKHHQQLSKKSLPNSVGVAAKRFAQFDKKFWAVYHTRLAPLLLLSSGNKSFPLRHFPLETSMFLSQILLIVGAVLTVGFLATACLKVPQDRPITGC